MLKVKTKGILIVISSPSGAGKTTITKHLINAEINNGSKDYDTDYIRRHVEKLTS